MITGDDIVRALTEWNNAYPDCTTWVAKVGIEEESFVTLMESMANACIKLMEAFPEKNISEISWLAATIASAYAVGFDMGRQIPATPFDE